MQRGYGEQTLFYKFFSFIIEKILFVQWFHFQKRGFMIFLNGTMETDFFDFFYDQIFCKVAIRWRCERFTRIYLITFCLVKAYFIRISIVINRALKERHLQFISNTILFNRAEVATSVDNLAIYFEL